MFHSLEINCSSLSGSETSHTYEEEDAYMDLIQPFLNTLSGFNTKQVIGKGWFLL